MPIITGHQLLCRFRELLRDAERVDIAVAWVKQCDALDALAEAAKEDTRIRVALGLSMNGTDPTALERLNEFATLRIASPRSGIFHPKFYSFRGSDWTTCWVGSSNLTAGGFGGNIELVHEFEDYAREGRDWFRPLWRGLDRDPEPAIAAYIEAYTPPPPSPRPRFRDNNRQIVPLPDEATWEDFVEGLRTRDDYCHYHDYKWDVTAKAHSYLHTIARGREVSLNRPPLGRRVRMRSGVRGTICRRLRIAVRDTRGCICDRGPSLGGNGYGDLLMEAEMDGRRAALLIEDKITASPAARQAERYRGHAERTRDEGFDCVRTVLVAPGGAYRDERERYDASVDLEQVADLLSSPDPRRLEYRREIIARALKKQRAADVKSPDHALREFHSDYLSWAGDRSAAMAQPYEFPLLHEAHPRNDLWIRNIRHPEFPENVWIRHRLWEQVENTAGLVDLIIDPALEEMQEQVRSSASIAFGDEAIVEEYSKHRKHGMKVSLRVPRMTQSTGFREDAAEHAFADIRRLTE